MKSETKQIIDKTAELVGKSSYGGFVRGIVHVITSLDEISKFKKGEILVTGMTDVNFSSAIKKAAAIVTEKGGVTCHAAIVSREMRKPCIVGVKLVTKALKTGDEVIVDATAGVVKLVE